MKVHELVIDNLDVKCFAQRTRGKIRYIILIMTINIINWMKKVLIVIMIIIILARLDEGGDREDL